MSTEIASVGDDVLPDVDEVLAAALVAQGERGARALGLLRDARRVLSGIGLERPAEVAESCVRGAADALLGLPGGPVAKGLQTAAKGLLEAVDAMQARAVSEPDPVSKGPSGAAGAAATAQAGGRPIPSPAPTKPTAASAGALAEVDADAWARVREAAEDLRREVVRPGGYHRSRAAGIAERLMGVALGSVQERALDVWGAMYGKASETVHGSTGAGPERAAAMYKGVLAAARELLVPLPGRAERVLQFVALDAPGAADALELAGWADPRATDFFFRSGPAPAWLAALDEHAPHLLLADETTGIWPAAPYLEHLSTTAPDTARTWLADHVEPLAAAGPDALDALLRLALAGVLGPAEVRRVVPHITARSRTGALARWTRQLAARWARTFPVAERDGDWLLVVECLLADEVEAEHTGSLALRVVAERAAALQRAAAGDPETDRGDDGDDWVLAIDEEELQERIAAESSGRLPRHDVASLLRELVRTAYPTGPAGAPFDRVRALRAAAAGLLRRDVGLTMPAARRLVFGGDLGSVRAEEAAFHGPVLARTVLDLAAADAVCGVDLAERTRAWRRIADVDVWLHGRLLACHLDAHPPAASAAAGGHGAAGDVQAAAEQEWWREAVALVPPLLAGRPDPEGARLVARLIEQARDDRAAEVERAARSALGVPPTAADVERVLPAGATRVDGTAEPLATWLRVWDWSPVLPPSLLDGFGPLLAALRRLEPSGPADPRRPEVQVPQRREPALGSEDMALLAAEQGPLPAAAALAAAPDAGADEYAMVLNHLVAADPVAWTADVPAVLSTLQLPELGAFYLSAVAFRPRTGRRGVLPAGPAPTAVAAFDLLRSLPFGAAERGPSAAEAFANQALFDLLEQTWRANGDLAGHLTAILAHLRELAGTLTAGANQPRRPQTGDGTDHTAPTGFGEKTGDHGSHKTAHTAQLLGSKSAVRALGCLLEFAAYRARACGTMPGDVLDLVADALTAHGDQEAVAAIVGVHLPELHQWASDFAAAHALYELPSDRPSPAAAWLRWGRLDRGLLAALHRPGLLAQLRTDERGAVDHVADAWLADPAFLGTPDTIWKQIADGPGGAAAAARLMDAIAGRTPRPTADAPPTAGAALSAATTLWRAALDADLPPGALAGAGAFVWTAMADPVWLNLTRRSAEHTATLVDADFVAERAASHPNNAEALLLVARLVACPAPAWHDRQVRQHARTLLQAATAQPAGERPDGIEELRRALINAGEVDAIRT